MIATAQVGYLRIVHTRRLLRAVLVLLACGSADAQSVDQSQPYGRAAVAVAEGNRETPFDATSQPGDGKAVAVYLDGNRASIALVVAFTRNDGSLANGWRPQLVELEEWEPQRVPGKPHVWEWKEAGPPFDLQVFFLSRDTPGLDRLRSLAAAMHREGSDATLAKLQERQLREIIAPWVAGEHALASRPANAPARIGGTVRAAGGEFPWRDFARSANFTAERPGVVTFRHDAR